ncbi:MAG: radical SAM protein, partial [Myxococcota bacterium]
MRPLLKIRRGHAPNCSSGSSVVGVALVSATIAGALINLYADRFQQWIDDNGDDDDAPPRLRRETFGAILAWAGVQLYLSPRWAMAAVQAGALPVGDIEPIEVPGALQAPTEVHLSLTRKCPVKCADCYLDAGPDAPDADLGALAQTLEALAEMGVFEVAFGGGEALLRPEVLDLADTARALGITPNLTTSGFGVTEGVAQR